MSHFQVSEQTTRVINEIFFSSATAHSSFFFFWFMYCNQRYHSIVHGVWRRNRRWKERECEHFFFFNFAQEKYKVICQTSDFALSYTMTLKKHTHIHIPPFQGLMSQVKEVRIFLFLLRFLVLQVLGPSFL